MGEGVKETICSRCTHKDTCKYKADFITFIRQLDELELKNSCGKTVPIRMLD